MRRPWVMTSSDASGGHPRAFGSFARKYAEYVRRRNVLSLRDFIERSTALPADTFRLADRGRLRPGAFADVVVFDPEAYAARATYEAADFAGGRGADGARQRRARGREWRADRGRRRAGACADAACRNLPMNLLRGWFAIALWKRVLAALALGLLLGAILAASRSCRAVPRRPVRPRDPDARRPDRAGDDRRGNHHARRSQADRRDRRAHDRPVRLHHRHRGLGRHGGGEPDPAGRGGAARRRRAARHGRPADALRAADRHHSGQHFRRAREGGHAGDHLRRHPARHRHLAGWGSGEALRRICSSPPRRFCSRSSGS